MKERPILFSTPMVQAILEGRKTMTRRIVKPQPFEDEFETGLFYPAKIDKDGELYPGPETFGISTADWSVKCPYQWQYGMKLWVRETFTKDLFGRLVYRATTGDYDAVGRKFDWQPSIFMPRSASRITLEITNIRVERLNEITKEDAIKEGIIPFQSNAQYGEEIMFEILWKGINGKGSWDANPWVWVIEFQKINC